MPCCGKVSWLRSKAVFLTILTSESALIEEGSGVVRARGTHEHADTCRMSFLTAAMSRQVQTQHIPASRELFVSRTRAGYSSAAGN